MIRFVLLGQNWSGRVAPADRRGYGFGGNSTNQALFFGSVQLFENVHFCVVSCDHPPSGSRAPFLA